jgi:predicted nucleotidyltransferase
MRTVGIIVEYNPLHNGHVYHYQQSRIVSGADAVVAVMSGHFLQRGEPALVNKWARAEMALRMGADLVIELPVAYSSQPAEWFAYGAVSALHASGVVDCLCFGSESGDIGWLIRLAEQLANEPERMQELLKQKLKQGTNYPDAYTQAVHDYIAYEQPGSWPEQIDRQALTQPNNTLGLHYLIALQRLGSRITPLTIKRTKAGYHDSHANDTHIASATAIRRILLEKGELKDASPYLPSYTLDILEREWAAGRAPIDWERLKGPLFHAVLSRAPDELAQLAEVTEGLENRIVRALSEVTGPWTAQAFIEQCKTRRYTQTKLQRAMTRVLLGHRKEWLKRDILARGVPYLRVLGFSNKGQMLLKRMKREASVPVITNVGRDKHPLLQLDIQATGIYALAYREYSTRDALRDYYEPPICLDSDV